MKFDDILKDVGEFGKYQKAVYFLLCLPSFATGLFMMHLVFVMETPNYRYFFFFTNCNCPDMNEKTLTRPKKNKSTEFTSFENDTSVKVYLFHIT